MTNALRVRLISYRTVTYKQVRRRFTYSQPRVNGKSNQPMALHDINHLSYVRILDILVIPPRVSGS